MHEYVCGWHQAHVCAFAYMRVCAYVRMRVPCAVCCVRARAMRRVWVWMCMRVCVRAGVHA